MSDHEVDGSPGCESQDAVTTAVGGTATPPAEHRAKVHARSDSAGGWCVWLILSTAEAGQAPPLEVWERWRPDFGAVCAAGIALSRWALRRGDNVDMERPMVRKMVGQWVRHVFHCFFGNALGQTGTSPVM